MGERLSASQPLSRSARQRRAPGPAGSSKPLRTKINRGRRRAVAAGKNVCHMKDNDIDNKARHDEQVFKMSGSLLTRNAFGGGSVARMTSAKKRVERLAGRIWFDSTPGQGCRFYITEQQAQPVKPMPSFTAVLRGSHPVFELAHRPYDQPIGRGASILRRTVIEAPPELADQPFPDLLNHVYRSGETSEAKSMLKRWAQVIWNPLTNAARYNELQPLIRVLAEREGNTDMFTPVRDTLDKAQGKPVLLALTGWGSEADKKKSKAAGLDWQLTKPVDRMRLKSLRLQAACPL